MSVTNDKLLLFKSHECSAGLSEEAQKEISDAMELVQYETEEYVHHASEAISAIYFIVQGRLKQSIMDMHGNSLFQRFLTRGAQFGALGAAQADPVPVDLVAVEPSATLKLDFKTALAFTRKHEIFGLNLTRSISNMVRQALLSDRTPKHASLVTVFHQTAASRPLTRRLIQRLLELGESPCVMSDRDDWEPIQNVAFRHLFENGERLSRDEFRRQTNQWSDRGRVILDVDASTDPINASQCIELSEQIYWCTTPDRVESSTERLKTLESRAPGWRDKINLVWILDKHEWVAPVAEELGGLVGRTFKVSASDPQQDQGRALLNGLERIVHQLRGIRVGLALGGGGARGMAHLGVLKALEENGIVVDAITGTSAGAMTGILYAAGYDADYVTQRFMEDLKPGWPFRMIPRGENWYLLYKYRRGHFDQMLRKYLSDWKLEQLPLPVKSLTVDLVTGKSIVRDSGDAVDAILESINLPVFSQPIRRDGKMLVDGGLLNNIPADVLVQADCNFVIAVSVTARLEAEFAKNRPDTPASQMRSASSLQTLLRGFLVQNVNMNSIGITPADVVIAPDVAGVDLSAFSETHALAEIGEATAIKMVPKTKSLLAQLDASLFPSA